MTPLLVMFESSSKYKLRVMKLMNQISVIYSGNNLQISGKLGGVVRCEKYDPRA